MLLPRNFNPPHVLRICSPCCFKSTYHQVSVCSWYRNDRASCVEKKLIKSINSRKHMLSRGSIPVVITVHNLSRKSPSWFLFKNAWVSFNLFVKFCCISLLHDFSVVSNVFLHSRDVACSGALILYFRSELGWMGTFGWEICQKSFGWCRIWSSC